MRARRTSSDHMQDILEYAGKAERFLEGIPSLEAFRGDERTLLAVIRALEVIGEAAKHIPKATRDRYPRVPWRGMMGIRDKVIHDYFGVDAEVVWRTVREDLPLLRETVASMLASEQGR